MGLWKTQVGVVVDTKPLAREMQRGIREHNETLKSNLDREIEARNRVDITLQEYETMKAEISNLRKRVGAYEDIFRKIQLPWDRKIIPGSIRVEYRKNPISFTEMCIISLEIDPFEGV